MSFVVPSAPGPTTADGAAILCGLAANQIEALVRLGTSASTAKELGFEGNVFVLLTKRGLCYADTDGRPTIYRASPLGLTALAYLNGKLEPVDCEMPVERIQRIVAKAFRIPVIEMVSDRRARRVARPRQVAMYLARETTTYSLPKIGRLFGGRDHTTVMHACNVVEELLHTDAGFRANVEALLGELADEPEAQYDYMTDEQREDDAARGSAMLRDAILAHMPESIAA